MTFFTTCNKTILATFAVTTLSFTALSSPALALDKDAFNESFQSAVKKMPFTVNSSNIEVKGTDVIFHDAQASYKQNPSKSLSIGDIYFNDVSEKDGGYLVKELKFSDFDANNNAVIISVHGFSFKNLILPAADSTDFFNSVLMYEDMQLDQLSANNLIGGKVFEMNNLSVHYSSFEDKKPIATETKIESFKFIPAATQNKDVIAMFDDFGMKVVEGDMAGKGLWDPFNDGRMAMDNVVVNVKNMGRLKINFDVTGMTHDVLNALQKLESDQASGALSEDKAGMIALSLMQQISITSVVLRYEDSGFTNKMFAYQAKKQKTTPDTLKTQVRGILPIFASMTGSASFAEEVKTASSAFIDNPKSLEISVKPKNTTSIASLILLGSMGGSDATAKVIEALNLHVMSNR